MATDIYDGFAEVEVLGFRIQMRANHLLIRPFLPEDGETESGLFLPGYANECPTCFGEVIAVSPAAINPAPDPKVGDIVIYERYATQQVSSPTLGCNTQDDGQAMATTHRGLHWLNINDVRAIIEPS